MRLSKLIISMFLSFGLMSVAQASDSGEVAVAKRLHEKFPKMSQATAPKRIQGIGLYEFVIAGQTSYTDEKVSYVLVGGELLSGSNGTVVNLTKSRFKEAVASGLEAFPLGKALKKVYGNGARQLVVFSDPDCPVCQNFEQMLEDNAPEVNATVYTLFLPLSMHPNSPAKVDFFACSDSPAEDYHKWMLFANQSGNKATAWSDWVIANNKSVKSCGKEYPFAEMRNIAVQRGFTMTPTIVFENGMNWNGNIDLEHLQKAYAYSDAHPVSVK